MRLVRAVPLHPLLFAAYPVLYLLAENLGEVPLPDVVVPLGRFVIIGAAALAIAAAAFRDARRGAIVASAFVIAIFTFGHVRHLVEPHGISLDVQQLGWLLAIGLAGILAVRIRDAGNVTAGMNVLALVLVITSLSSIVPYHLGTAAQARGARPPAGSGGPAPTGSGGPDIYYLVFDRYGSERSLELMYGVTDNELIPWLTERGFAIAPDSHANYVRTSLSLGATLNMTDLSFLSGRVDRESEDFGPIHGLLQDHAVGRYLQRRGYRYFHVGSWFGPTREARIADVNLRWDEATDFDANLLETTVAPVVLDDLGAPELPPEDLKHWEAARHQFEALDAIRGEPGPKFVYAHILLPHDPYVFDAAGRYVPEEVRDATPVPELFRAQLTYTNRRIQEIISPLLDRPVDRQPIVIVQADEGPYPTAYDRDKIGFDWATATPQELEIKFGIMNAVRVPGAAYELPPTISSVNTFRLLFSRVFGEELPLLPDRSYSSARFDRPYAFDEITDRLPSLRSAP